MNGIKGKTAIISGADRGIGKAIALELAKEGAHVAFNYFRNEQAAGELENELNALGIRAQATQVDIRDYNAVVGWVKKTREVFGGLDIVVNNAGIINDKALMMMEKEDWQNVLDTNLGGVFNLTRAAIIGLLKQQSGSIVNISSITGVIGQPSQTNYAASKAGIIGFTKSLAKEVAKYNIRVNCVAPGFVETDMVKGLKEQYRGKVLEKIPLARFGTPEEVAKAVKFLAGDEAGFITGQVLIVDGGLGIAI
jgi:3-oxoacyl-[acyl-carrier protein] reductase